MVEKRQPIKRERCPTLREGMTGVITQMARMEQQLIAHGQLLERIESEYKSRMSAYEKELKENCVTADTALFEARNNTDRSNIIIWVIGGITLFLTTALAIILQVILTR